MLIIGEEQERKSWLKMLPTFLLAYTSDKGAGSSRAKAQMDRMAVLADLGGEALNALQDMVVWAEQLIKEADEKGRTFEDIAREDGLPPVLDTARLVLYKVGVNFNGG